MLLPARILSRRSWQASSHLLRSVAAVAALVSLTASLGAQGGQQVESQAGRATLTGTVKDVQTGAPLVGVTVKVAGLGVQVSTDVNGVYKIPNLPMGTTPVVVDAQRLGYSGGHVEGVILNKATVTQDITLNASALQLEALTSSATTDPTTGVKNPLPVAHLDAENIPVPNPTDRKS